LNRLKISAFLGIHLFLISHCDNMAISTVFMQKIKMKTGDITEVYDSYHG